MPLIACPHCVKREIVPLAICESWNAEAVLKENVWFLTCEGCSAKELRCTYMRIGAGTVIRLLDGIAPEFASLNQNNVSDFTESCVLESHTLRPGLHGYVVVQQNGKEAIVLDSWIATDNQPVLISERAVREFKKSLECERMAHIRLSISNNPQTGSEYRLQIDNGPIDASDWVNDMHGFLLVVDQESWSHAKGTTIDWQVTSEGKAGFRCGKLPSYN
jgi:Fe-S cluster assembly iron-binding protein IscA